MNQTIISVNKPTIEATHQDNSVVCNIEILAANKKIMLTPKN